MTDDITQLNDDIFEGAVASPEDYADPTFSILPEGKYELKINKFGWAKDKEGNITKPEKPTLVLEEVEVVNPEAFRGRKAFFLRIMTASFERNGKKVSAFGDFMRAIDKGFDWENKPNVAYDRIRKASQQGDTFLARLRWEAFDSDFWNAEDGVNQDKDTQKELAKRARLSGMKNFATDSQGKPIPEWVGPSGATIDARMSIGQVYTSDKKK